MRDFPFLHAWIDASLEDILRSYLPRARPETHRLPECLPTQLLGDAMQAQGLFMGAKYRGEALQRLIEGGLLQARLKQRWIGLTGHCPPPELEALQPFHRQRFVTYLEYTVMQRLLKRPGFLWFHGMVEHPKKLWSYGELWAQELEAWLRAHALSWPMLEPGAEAEVICLNTGLLAGPQRSHRAGVTDAVAEEVLLLLGGSLYHRLGGHGGALPLLRNAIMRRACEWADLEQTFRSPEEKYTWMTQTLNLSRTTIGSWLADETFEDEKARQFEQNSLFPLQLRVQHLLQERSPGWLTARDVTDHAWEHWPRPYPDAAVIARLLEGLAHTHDAKRRSASRDGQRTVEYSALAPTAGYTSAELMAIQGKLTGDVRHLCGALSHAGQSERGVFAHSTHHLVPRAELDAFFALCQQLQGELDGKNVSDGSALSLEDWILRGKEEFVIAAQCSIHPAPLTRPDREYR